MFFVALTTFYLIQTSFFGPVKEYAKFLAINTAWQLFAPDPSPVIDLQYTVYKDGEELLQETFPKARDQYSLQEIYMRRLNTSRFLALDSRRVSEIFVPWICKQNPAATDIKVQRRVGQLRTVEEVLQNKKMTEVEHWQITDLVFEPCETGVLQE